MSTTNSVSTSSALRDMRIDPVALEQLIRYVEDDGFDDRIALEADLMALFSACRCVAIGVFTSVDAVDLLRLAFFPDMCFSAGRSAGFRYHAMIFTDRPQLVRYVGYGPTEARARLAAVLRGLLAHAGAQGVEG